MGVGGSLPCEGVIRGFWQILVFWGGFLACYGGFWRGMFVSGSQTGVETVEKRGKVCRND